MCTTFFTPYKIDVYLKLKAKKKKVITIQYAYYLSPV
jgi:hypothetical protein